MPSLSDAALDAAGEYVFGEPVLVDLIGGTRIQNDRIKPMTARQKAEVVVLRHLVLDALWQIPEGHGAEALDRNRMAPTLTRRLTKDEFLAICGKVIHAVRQ